MVTIVATLFGIGIGLYVTAEVCRREFRIVLRWPALVLLGLLMLATFTSMLGTTLFPESRVAWYLSTYPSLFFVLGCIAAFGLGRLGRKRPGFIYRRASSADA